MEALPQLVILALITGLLTGCVILAFRYLVDLIALTLLDGGQEDFESLTVAARIALPLTGALIIGAGLTRLAAEERRVGVVHVMERLSRHQGYLPAKTAVVQFLGGIIALASGQSGGREGPAIHLGAASASLLGQSFRLPNNSIRTLVACGTAAAIASSFNTPMAGVIFAMEVVMMEYTIGSFIPVIVAAVTSTLLTHYALGNETAFTVAPLHMESILEIPYIFVGGLFVGTLAAGFITLVRSFANLSHWPFWSRALLAGALTAACAPLVPEIMGVGYDTVNGAMLGQLTLTTLFILVAAKMLTSAATVGLGMPLGLIGPTLVIGAAFGGIWGLSADNFYGNTAVSSEGFYVMLGMSAMMAAVLQAPLAALMTILEMTGNPNVILPAMLIIVVATLTTSEVFKCRSVFLTTLNTLGLQYPPNPVTLHMQRAGVASIMERDIRRLPPEVSEDDARAALRYNPRWILVETSPGEIRCILNAPDLQAFLDERQNTDVTPEGIVEDRTADHPIVHHDVINLLKIPGMRKDVGNIDARATIGEAQETLTKSGVEALCVRRTSAPMIAPILGVVTNEQIDNYREIAH